MSDEPGESHFQFRLSAALLFTAAIYVAFALIGASHAEVALCAAFPFAVGVVVGQFPNAFVLSSPWIAAIIVPPLWIAIGAFFEPLGHGTFAVNTISAMLGVLMLGAIPALAGSIISRWLVAPTLRRFRWSLRTLFIVVTVCAPLIWLGSIVYQRLHPKPPVFLVRGQSPGSGGGGGAKPLPSTPGAPGRGPVPVGQRPHPPQYPR